MLKISVMMDLVNEITTPESVYLWACEQYI